jgi:hypothetical protein
MDGSIAESMSDSFSAAQSIAAANAGRVLVLKWMDEIDEVDRSSRLVPRADVISDGKNRPMYWTIATSRRCQKGGKRVTRCYYYYWTFFKAE